MERILCPNCGADATSDDFVCPKCSVILNEAAAEAEPVSMVQALLSPSNSAAASRSSPRGDVPEGATRRGVIVMDEHTVPHLIAGVSIALKPLHPFEALVASYVDGALSVPQIAEQAGITKVEAMAVLQELVFRDIVELRRVEREAAGAASEAEQEDPGFEELPDEDGEEAQPVLEAAPEELAPDESGAGPDEGGSGAHEEAAASSQANGSEATGSEAAGSEAAGPEVAGSEAAASDEEDTSSDVADPRRAQDAADEEHATGIEPVPEEDELPPEPKTTVEVAPSHEAAAPEPDEEEKTDPALQAAALLRGPPEEAEATDSVSTRSPRHRRGEGSAETGERRVDELAPAALTSEPPTRSMRPRRDGPIPEGTVPFDPGFRAPAIEDLPEPPTMQARLNPLRSSPAGANAGEPEGPTSQLYGRRITRDDTEAHPAGARPSEGRSVERAKRGSGAIPSPRPGESGARLARPSSSTPEPDARSGADGGGAARSEGSGRTPRPGPRTESGPALAPEPPPEPRTAPVKAAVPTALPPALRISAVSDQELREGVQRRPSLPTPVRGTPAAPRLPPPAPTPKPQSSAPLDEEYLFEPKAALASDGRVVSEAPAEPAPPEPAPPPAAVEASPLLVDDTAPPPHSGIGDFDLPAVGGSSEPPLELARPVRTAAPPKVSSAPRPVLNAARGAHPPPPRPVASISAPPVLPKSPVAAAPKQQGKPKNAPLEAPPSQLHQGPSTEFVLERAIALERRGDVEGAIYVLKRAIAGAKDPGPLYNKLALALVKRKEFRQAVSLLEKAVELEPENGAYQQNLMKVVALTASAGGRAKDDAKAGFLSKLLGK